MSEPNGPQIQPGGQAFFATTDVERFYALDSWSMFFIPKGPYVSMFSFSAFALGQSMAPHGGLAATWVGLRLGPSHRAFMVPGRNE